MITHGRASAFSKLCHKEGKFDTIRFDVFILVLKFHTNVFHRSFSLPIFLTPRCRTLKVPKVGTFSWYLRVTTFWGFKIYTQNYMTLRDFDNFFFFAWILCFLCASLHATEFVKKWCKTKWSCFYIIIWAFVILRVFCVKKKLFFIIFMFSFPIDTSMKLFTT